MPARGRRGDARVPAGKLMSITAPEDDPSAEQLAAGVPARGTRRARRPGATQPLSSPTGYSDSRWRSASMAAMQPVPAAVIACR